MRKRLRITLLVIGVMVLVTINTLVLMHREASIESTSGGYGKSTADIMQKGESGIPVEIPEIYEDAEDHDPPGELKD